jgi:hypothetical protein
MIFIAKGFEAIGIACVMIGLVQGIQSNSMWIELYLSIAGIIIFLLGWAIEKYPSLRSSVQQRILHRRTSLGKRPERG